MKLKLNIWVAIDDIVNACIFAVSWFLIIGSSFSDAFGGTSTLGSTSSFLGLVAAIGLILHIIQLAQCRRWGNSLVSSILGIIGNTIFFLAPLFALPAIILLIISAVFEFINKVKTETKEPIHKIWYKTWWEIVAIVVVVIAFFVSVSSANSGQKKSGNTSMSKSFSSSNDTSKKSSKDLISIDKNIIKTPKGTIEIKKEATGKTTDGKDGVILMYKVTNNSNTSLTPKQILAGNQISLYEKDSKSDKPAQQFFGADDFQDLSDVTSDSSEAIVDAIEKDNDNWSKTKIAPHQSITMSDGMLWKMDNSKNSEIKVTDINNDVDGNVINKDKNSYKISSPVEKIDVTKWNG